MEHRSGVQIQIKVCSTLEDLMKCVYTRGQIGYVNIRILPYFVEVLNPG